MSAPVLLQTEQLTRAFGSLLAVDRVDLTIRRGELRSIIGPNGAGKTTLFRLISGEIRPTGGGLPFAARGSTRAPRRPPPPPPHPPPHHPPTNLPPPPAP